MALTVPSPCAKPRLDFPVHSAYITPLGGNVGVHRTSVKVELDVETAAGAAVRLHAHSYHIE